MVAEEMLVKASRIAEEALPSGQPGPTRSTLGRMRWLRAIVLFALAFAWTGSGLAQRAAYCGKLVGLLERNHTFGNSSEALAFAGSLAPPTAPYLFLRRTTSQTQAYALAGALIEAMSQSEPGGKTLTVDQVERNLRAPELRATIAELGAASANSPTEPNWYLQSNAPGFAELIGITDARIASSGVILQCDKAGESRALAAEVERLAAQLKLRLILVEGDVDLPPPSFADSRTAPMILRLRSAKKATQEQSRTVATARRLQTATAERTLVLSLMPQNAAEGIAWGFAEERAQAYATNGERVVRDLAAYGYTNSLATAKSPREAIDRISEARAKGKDTIVIVGEAAEGGALRVPASAELLTGDLLRAAVGDAVLVALSCSSEGLKTDGAGLSTVGTVYTDQVRSVLRVIFDTRPAASVAEYLDLPVSPGKDPVASVAAILARIIPDLASGMGPRLPILLILSQGAPTPSPTPIGPDTPPPATPIGPETPPSNLPSPLAVAAAGALGALAREFFRWKRLTARKRADLFRKPRYFGISLAQIVIASATAALLLSTFDGRWVLAVAFTYGAGLEELVRRAAKLAIWTPDVPHGPGTPDVERGTDETLLEYLRS